MTRLTTLLVMAALLAGGGPAEAKDVLQRCPSSEDCFGERKRGPDPAETIFLGGPILTINPVGEAQALAVTDGLIVAVGDLSSVMEFKGPSTTVIDLKGKTLMPGFVEPHLHINLTANNLSEVQCGSEEPGGLSVEDVKTALTKALPLVPPGGWLAGNGFDPSRTKPLFATLTLDDLNSISTTVPIFVLNASGHIAYVNSKAYEVAGVTNSTPNPTGGTYVRDAQGNLTGQLNEPPAYAAFTATFPTPSYASLLSSWQQTLAGFSNKGVTTVGDLNTGLSHGFDVELRLLRDLAPTSPVRIRSYLSYLALPKDLSTPVQPFEGDDKLRFIGVKFTTDGSTQGFTAALNEPYVCIDTKSQCALGSTGTLDFPDTTQLKAFARHFFDAGWQISSHANGDRAIDQVLDVYSALLAGAPGQDPAARRLRIEHFTVTEEAQIDRVKQLGLTVSMTDGHIFFWGHPFDLNILGPQRAVRIDPVASLKARGVRYSFHSDSTVTSVNVLRYMQTAITRATQLPQVDPPRILGPDQRITIDDALRANTLDAAFQLFMDDRIGSLEVGKYADLVVLDRNPRTTDPFQLTSINIIDVYLAGQRQGP